jgi:DNA-binding transcriptional ArsR family regulator
LDDLPEVYHLETIEQVRALADELRLRITDLLSKQPMTVKQIGTTLKVSSGKVHYHVRELERVGLLKLVETREKRGILEKYYRTVAWSLNVPETLLSRLPDETFAQVSQFLQILAQGFTRVMAHAVRTQQFEGEDAVALSLGAAQIWVTNDELKDLLRQMRDLFKAYRAPRGVLGEREVTFAHVVYDATLADAGHDFSTTASAPAPERSTPSSDANPRARQGTRNVFTAGATEYSRDQLEQIVARGQTLDINALGYCRFADDIPAALVEQAIGSFRCRGVLSASPEVRAVLKRKELKATEETKETQEV